MKDVVVIPLRVQESVVRTLTGVQASTWIVPDDFQVPAGITTKVVRYSTATDVRFQIPELAAAYRRTIGYPPHRERAIGHTAAMEHLD